MYTKKHKNYGLIISTNELKRCHSEKEIPSEVRQ